MFEMFSSIFGYLMNYIYMIVQNYGVAILIFTVLVKVLLLPLTIKQQKSMAAAQKMQPIIKELQNKYGKDQQKFNEEYQKALKENNMTMMSSMGCSGCLINLIQIPILFGMFYMMVSPLKYIMKVDEAEILKYKDEINDSRKAIAIEQLVANSGDYPTLEEYNIAMQAAQDKLYVHERYYEIDIIEDKKLMDMNFLGINLSDIASEDKENKILLIIPILSMLFTFLSTKITTKLTEIKTGKTQKQTMEETEVPLPDMRVMNITMPIMLGFVAYSVPQGVGLYWTASNLLGIIQMLAIESFTEKNKLKVKYKMIDEKSTIEDNKKDK